MNAYFRRVLRGKMSLQAIADAMNARFGVQLTRNAMIGKAHRIGVSIAHADRLIQRKPRVRKSPPIDPAAPEAAPPPPVKREPRRPLEIIELGYDTCRYPYGDTPPYLYCGEEVHHGAYCEEHAAVCYMRPRPGGR